MSKAENFQHIVFRTKYSQNTIPEACKRTILAYIYQVSTDIGAKVLRLNSHHNHVHIFVDLPTSVSVSEYVKKIKATSSKQFNGHPEFPMFSGWATGFGSFSKSRSDCDKVITYIKNQEEHHRHKTFREELEEFFGKEFFNDPFNRRDWLDEVIKP